MMATKIFVNCEHFFAYYILHRFFKNTFHIFIIIWYIVKIFGWKDDDICISSWYSSDQRPKCFFQGRKWLLGHCSRDFFYHICWPIFPVSIRQTFCRRFFIKLFFCLQPNGFYNLYTSHFIQLFSLLVSILFYAYKYFLWIHWIPSRKRNMPISR